MYSHRVNSPKNLAKYSGNTSSQKYFPVFARVRIQAPHVFSQKLIPQEICPACIGFVPGGSSFPCFLSLTSAPSINIKTCRGEARGGRLLRATKYSMCKALQRTTAASTQSPRNGRRVMALLLWGALSLLRSCLASPGRREKP